MDLEMDLEMKRGDDVDESQQHEQNWNIIHILRVSYTLHGTRIIL